MFYIERSNPNGGWDIMMASPEPVTLNDIMGPEGAYPVNYNYPAFAGIAGQEARIRFKDSELERYAWGKVPENPNDPDSMTKPGWELRAKYPWPSEAQSAGSWLSCMGNGPPSQQIECGEAPPKAKDTFIEI